MPCEAAYDDRLTEGCVLRVVVDEELRPLDTIAEFVGEGRVLGAARIEDEAQAVGTVEVQRHRPRTLRPVAADEAIRGGFGRLLSLAGSEEEEGKEARYKEAEPRKALRKRAKVHRVGHGLGEFVDLEEVAAVARLGVGLLRTSGNEEAGDTFALRGAEEGRRAEAGGRLR